MGTNASRGERNVGVKLHACMRGWCIFDAGSINAKETISSCARGDFPCIGKQLKRNILQVTQTCEQNARTGFRSKGGKGACWKERTNIEGRIMVRAEEP